MEKIKSNLGLILYLFIIIILTIIMIWAINQKEGFHEDEMFSYGASNSTLGNTFCAYGRRDDLDTIIKDKNLFITIKNYIHYRIVNPNDYANKHNKLYGDNFKSVWRTPEDAIEYLQIDNVNEALDFATIYWNTAKDVHPPLFYYIVHIVSIFRLK